MNNITNTSIVKALEENYMPYSMSVIISRALPEIDGLKPSHRKLLYTMYKMNLIKGSRTKSANIVGQTMKLNPHGDGAIYETMVRLTKGNESLLYPLIDSKGNFGKKYSRDMSYAAHRYTEAKLEKITEEFFKDINKDLVDFTPNYDNTVKEPTLLPTTFPSILTSPNLGIAVGMASNIPSFNLKEVCNLTIKYIKNPNMDVSKNLLVPDFSTGGSIIYSKDIFEKIYKTGRGSFKIRGKYKYDKKNNCIDIFEIPYTTTVENIIDKIIENIKNNTLREISDIRDETDKNGLKITIDLKKSVSVDALILKLYKLTSFEDTFSVNFNILIDSKPKVMGINEILDNWIKFRTKCIKRAVKYDLKKFKETLHLLKGLEAITLDIDKVINIIRSTKKDSNVIKNIKAGFNIDTKQAEYISEIKLRNLNQEYLMNKTSEIKKLNEEIERLELVYNSKEELNNIIIKDLKRVINKYSTNRKTDIINEDKVREITKEEMIDDYNVKYFFTKDGYFKKIPLTSLRSDLVQKVKEKDKIIYEIEGTNKSELLFFSNMRNVYKAKGFEFKDSKASELGEYLKRIFKLKEDEEIRYLLKTDDYKGFLIFCYENGKIAKVPLDSYKTKTNRKKLANAYYDKSKLVHMEYLKEDKDLVLISSINKVIIFNTDMLSIKKTKNSNGVQVMKSKNNSYLKQVNYLKEVEFKDNNYYKSNIPAIGTFLKKNDYILNINNLKIKGV